MVRRWAVAAVLAAVYFGVHQLFDLLVNMPAALFAFAFPIAWLDANAGVIRDHEAVTRSNGRGTAAFRRRSLVLGAGALAVGVAVGWAIASERSALALDGAKTALDAGDASTAARLSADAVALDPSIPPDQLLLALATIREGQTPVARSALETVVGADSLPAAWIDLAWLDAAAGNAEGARSALVEGAAPGRQQPAIALAAGRIERAPWRSGAADGLHATALTLLPRLAADPYWRDPERAGRWAGISRRRPTGSCPRIG